MRTQFKNTKNINNWSKISYTFRVKRDGVVLFSREMWRIIFQSVIRNRRVSNLFRTCEGKFRLTAIRKWTMGKNVILESFVLRKEFLLIPCLSWLSCDQDVELRMVQHTHLIRYTISAVILMREFLLDFYMSRDYLYFFVYAKYFCDFLQLLVNERSNL